MFELLFVVPLLAAVPKHLILIRFHCDSNGFLIHLHSMKVMMNQKSSTLNSTILPQRLCR